MRFVYSTRQMLLNSSYCNYQLVVALHAIFICWRKIYCRYITYVRVDSGVQFDSLVSLFNRFDGGIALWSTLKSGTHFCDYIFYITIFLEWFEPSNKSLSLSLEEQIFSKISSRVTEGDNCFNFIIILLNNGGSFTFSTYSPIRINYQMKIKTKWMIVPIVFPCETSIKNRSALRHWWSIQNRIGIKYSKMSKIIVEAICWKIVSHFRMWFGKINVE